MSQWNCKKCGRFKGDFEMMGAGLVRCPGCGATYFVQPGGDLTLVADFMAVLTPQSLPEVIEGIEREVGQ